MQSPNTNPLRNDMQQRIEEFAGQVVGDLAAAMAGVMTNLGHKLGLYRAMAESGPINSDELARRTATNERSVREWLNGQVVGGYVLFDAATKQYFLPAEHAFVLANPDSPAFLPPAFDVAASLWNDEDQILAAFRSGEGVGWHEHDCRLFTATEAFFRNGYRAHLTQTWIPSLSGVQDQLANGGRVADLGCGHGASVILMAQAFPKSKFVGIDYHESSIAVARERAKQAGVADQIRFEVATPRVLASNKEQFDLVCFMDSLHDMGDPLEAVWASRQAMARTAHSCWWNRLQRTGLRKISALLQGCTTRLRLASVPRTHSRREDVIHWERRLALPNCWQSSRTRASGAQRWQWKLRST